MQIKVKTVDLQKLSRDIYKLDADMQGKVWREAAEAGANFVAEKIDEGMHEPKGGYKYPHLPNRSSAPGEVPAYQFGDLWGSKQQKVTKQERDKARVELSFGGVAILMEFGTSRMHPRKFLRATVDEFQDEIHEVMEEKPNEVIDRFMRKR